jgi:predicted RNase H-like HicB family nuclease
VARFDYPILIEPLAPEDGGGFVATVPDLPGCMSAGETPEEALANVHDAVAAWIEEAQALGRAGAEPPAATSPENSFYGFSPSSSPGASGAR